MGFFQDIFKNPSDPHSPAGFSARDSRPTELRILKRGPAMRVIFFYPGEEGTYVDNAEVTLYENGIIHLRSSQEETTTHLKNCEILWRFEVDGDDRTNKFRLLKFKKGERDSDADAGSDSDPSTDLPPNARN
jgi:hypothetical protein